MQGQYYLQAPLGLNCGSSICLQEHTEEKQKKISGITQISHPLLRLGIMTGYDVCSKTRDIKLCI